MNPGKLCRLILIGVCLSGCLPAAHSEGQQLNPFGGRAAPQDGRNAVRPGSISSVEFVDTPITTIFKMVSDLTGWSIIASPAVSQQPPRINIWIKNMTADEVIEEVCMMAGLIHERKGNTIKILTFDEHARLYGVEKTVLPLEHASAVDVVTALKPYADKADQARIVADKASNKVILLVPRPLTASLERIAQALDVPYDADVVKVVPLQYLSAPTIVSVLEAFFGRATTSRGGMGTGTGTTPSPTVPSGGGGDGASVVPAGEAYRVAFMVEPRLNSVVLRGAPTDVAQAIDLIVQLDVPPKTKTNSYELRYTNADAVFETLERVISGTRRTIGGTGRGASGGESQLQLAVSEQNNRIVVYGTLQDHAQVLEAIEAIDKPLPPGTGGLRVYRLENTTSEMVAGVIQSVIDERQKEEEKYARHGIVPGGEQSQGIHRVSPVPGASGGRTSAPGSDESTAAAIGDTTTGLSVTEAPDINAVIIRATAAEHEEFAAIISELDQPRGQVMLEMTLVRVTTNNAFNLGIELGGTDLNGPTTALSLTTFGVGQADTATGQMALAGASPFGLNVGIFNSDDFQFVLNALETVGDVRVTSAPRILVEDNAPASIKQVQQEPYEITSQGDATTQTAFGGFVDAGTVLQVIPHLTRQNWLRLEYMVDLSTFGDRISQALPPPRSQNTVQGTVRVPEAYTIVLGGLVTTRESETVGKVPLLGDIPLLGELFKTRQTTDAKETLFVFIRPVVLRDPMFRDLVYLSEKDIREAKLQEAELPQNPMLMLTPIPVPNQQGAID